MRNAFLLRVENVFQLERFGLVVRPDFSVPAAGFPSQRTEKIVVATPEGTRFETDAQFNFSHFRIVDPESTLDQRWRITVCLTGVGPDELPLGSQIFATQELVELLCATTEPKQTMQRVPP